MQERVARPLDRLKPWGMAALVLALVLACYWPSLDGALIWNDREYVPTPDMRSLHGLNRIWTQPGATEQYYPLLYSWLWLQCRLWGENPLGYHLVGMILHAGAAVLFAFALRRLAVPGAWLAALIFALHPVHVQSVAWITEQKNTLSLVFYLGAVLSYLHFDENRRWRTYVLALSLFLLSIPCKTVTVTLPAALLVILWWKRGRLDPRRDCAPLIPWFVLGASAGLFTSWIERQYVGAHGGEFSLAWSQRILVAGRACWFYLGHVMWPARLNFVYPRWELDAGDPWQWLFPAGTCVLAAALWALRVRSRAPLAVFLLFAGSLFPVLGVVSFYSMRYSWVWDHWQYLPDLAPVALLAAGLALGWNSLGARWRRPGAVVIAVMVLAFGAMTRRHTRMFHDNETLYRATLDLNPGCWMAHNNLAADLTGMPGHEAEAIAHYESALRLRPGYAEAHNNLANLLAAMPGRGPEALSHYEAALRIQPDLGEAHDNLANLLAAMPGRGSEALTHYEAALRIKPRNADAHFNMAGLLARMPGREPDAIAHYLEAIRLRPGNARACNNLAVVCAQLGRVDDARKWWNEALRIDPGYEDARNNLRLLDSLKGR